MKDYKIRRNNMSLKKLNEMLVAEGALTIDAPITAQDIVDQAGY